MINPKLKAKDRIFSELPDNIKSLMNEYILSDEDHKDVLDSIKKVAYRGKKVEENPKFIIVLGQTGSGKSNLTAKLIGSNSNLVIIDSDKYKEYRKDTRKILEKHMVEYAFLTAPDAYQHRDEMIYDTMKNKYNILMECATSEKNGMFVDIERIKKQGYTVELNVMGVSELNSLLSIHERYEAQIMLNYPAAKLTGIERHDDSYTSLGKVIKNIENNDIKITIYQRGEKYPYVPEAIYSSNDICQRFSSVTEALEYSQNKDRKNTIERFPERYTTIQNQMFNRSAPESQLQQLEEVRKRYSKLIEIDQERE